MYVCMYVETGEQEPGVDDDDDDDARPSCPLHALMK
jgi:hypothetical protein